MQSLLLLLVRFILKGAPIRSPMIFFGGSFTSTILVAFTRPQITTLALGRRYRTPPSSLGVSERAVTSFHQSLGLALILIKTSSLLVCLMDILDSDIMVLEIDLSLVVLQNIRVPFHRSWLYCYSLPRVSPILFISGTVVALYFWPKLAALRGAWTSPELVCVQR